MFGKKKSTLPSITSVLLTEGETVHAFVSDVAASLSAGHLALVISHFTETHNRVSAQLSAEGHSSQTLSAATELKPYALETLGKKKTVALIPFPLLAMAAPFEPSSQSQDIQADLFIPELYPTLSRDPEVEAFGESLPFEASLHAYCAVNAPILNLYSGGQLEQTMRKLGIQDGERIEHAFLQKALNKARTKIGKKVSTEQNATSQQEWLNMNMR